MKKGISLALVFVMLCSLLGCAQSGPSSTRSEALESNSASGTVESQFETVDMKVAVMPYAISMPVYFAIESGLAEDYGLNLEMIMFSSGATMNEAMASNQFDVAPIGGAGIYGIATYDGVYVADQVIYEKEDDGELTGGDGIYCLADNPVVEIKGFNPEFPNVCGDPDTVRGSTILYTSGTTAHQLVIMWLDTLGIAMDEVNMLNMDFAQSYNALKTNQADFACLTSPYTTQAQNEGYAVVADGKSLHQSSVESIMAPRDYYESNKENLARFVCMLYEANRQLEEGGIEMKVEWMKKWYDYNGTSYTAEEVYAEMENGVLCTWDTYDQVEYGAYARDLAEFYLLNELLTDDAVANVESNITTDVFEMAKEMANQAA